MFRGTHDHTIDTKGRIIIPARFREIITTRNSDRVMISALDGCLVGYPLDTWEQIEQRILSQESTSDLMRRFRRFFIGRATECTFDKQGRILVPPTLRQYAGMDRDIVLVGVLDHFEIWARERWDDEQQKLEADLQEDELRSAINHLGL